MNALLLLAAIWILLIKPEPGPEGLRPTFDKEFEVEQVEFSSLDDCETYARLYAQKHALKKRPDGTVATYTCVARER